MIRIPFLPWQSAMHDPDDVDADDLIYSPLQQSYTEAGKTVQVCIYRLPETGWILEIEDGYGNSIVYDGEFKTDREAFDLFKQDVQALGIDSMIGPAPEIPAA